MIEHLVLFFYRNKMKDKGKMVMKGPFEKGCLHYLFEVKGGR